MSAPSVFLEFNFPNATTWFYFSFILAVTLFFKFARILSIRNLDVVLLFLLVPGMLLIQRSRPGAASLQEHQAVKTARLVGLAAPGREIRWAGPVAGVANLSGTSTVVQSSRTWVWVGYLWLLSGSVYFFLRCLFDLALVQRPALAPNLSFGGLAWFASAMFVCLIALAFRQSDPSPQASPRPAVTVHPPAVDMVGREAASLALAREWFAPPDWMTRGFACLCHLLVVIGMVLVGWRHFHDPAAGMAAATFYLLLPYTGIHVSQVHHVWPMALVIWALVCFRLPVLAGTLLGLAAGTAYFPALVLPIWFSFYWKRGAGRFFAFFAVATLLCLLAVALVLDLEGQLDSSIRDVMAQNAWQAWKIPTTEGFWTGMHWAYRIPVFLGYFAFVLTTLLWPAPKNLAHVIALSAAVFIGIQFWYADQGGVYVLWYLPLLLLLMFRPNLADTRPDAIDYKRDWLCRLGRSGRRFLRWTMRTLLRTPPTVEPASK